VHKQNSNRWYQYVKRENRRRIWKKIVEVMACVVVFCTTYALILPAITLEMEPYCGNDEHIHEEACYQPEPDPLKIYLHSHDEYCFGPDGQLLCPLTEHLEHIHDELCYQLLVSEPEAEEESETEPPPEAHSHDESCYTRTQGELLCQLEETEGHSHEAACYELGTEPICEQEETEGHSHDETCYEQQLICLLSESEAHSHGDDCYELGTEPICEQEETEGHIHDETCYEQQLICLLSESEAHSHGDDCYVWEELLNCPLEEASEQPTEEPSEETEEKQEELTEKILICELPELFAHSHSDDCYNENETLICGLEELSQHQHSEDCLRFLPEDLICTEENEAHQHSQSCYSAWRFACQLEEESTAIKPDLTADVETPEIWEESMASVELSGKAAEDLVAIAKTQLGYQESRLNFQKDAEGSPQFYNRYGAYCGKPYEPWNTYFVSFCLDYAGLKDYPQNPSAQLWMEELKTAELYRSAADHKASVGDLIFRSLAGEDPEQSAVRVGIVLEQPAEQEGETALLSVLEGDVKGEVAICSLPQDDPSILGYGLLPKAEEPPYDCGLEEHLHDERCYAEDGTLICGKEEHTHSEACRRRLLSYQDDSMQVTLTLTAAEALPKNLSLDVQSIREDSDAAKYQAMYAAVGEELYSSPYFVGNAAFFQMQLMDGENPYQPQNELKAEVRISFTEPVFTEDEVSDAVGLHTLLLSEEAPEAPETEEEPVESPEVQILSEEVSGELHSSQALMMASGIEAEPTEPSEAAETEATEEAAEPLNYQASLTTVSSYEEADSGLMGISFSSNGVSSVALALSTTVQEGMYWERVTSLSQLNANSNYLIVSAEGNYVMTNGSGIKADVEMVKGNPGYYTIKDANGNNISGSNTRWNFQGSGSARSIRNLGNASYLTLGSSLLSNSSQNVTLTYLEAEQCWTFHRAVRSGLWNTTYYLTNSGSSSFSSSFSSDNYTRSMLIFKLSDKTSMTIPDDVIASSGNEPESDKPTKPTYKDYLPVSGPVQGQATSLLGVAGTAYSDPATSQLESLFSGDTAHDGRVMSDKSVIYKKDDYNAFQSYEDNTFGVTLSALGQEYLTAEQSVVNTPIDVVFVLDVSGSMKYKATTASNSNSRAEAMVDAVNNSIQEIMAQNPENRVGVTLFSTGAWDLLELGSYQSNNGKYIYTQNSYMSKFGENRYQVYAYDDIRRQVSQPALEEMDQANGTYTQAGIAKGAAMLERSEPKTYTAVLNEGTEYEKSITVKRQPVIILLSDGEPTHCTSNYKDVLSGPHYGDGVAQGGTYQGVYGYYTILSANYYKRMVGISYDNPALFYTVGMGISKDQDVDLSGVGADSDVYKRAVLNPTVSNIINLSSSINSANTVQQLKSLMLNNYSGSHITVSVTNQSYMSSWMGNVHAAVPVLENPYSGNYSYAEKAYFGQISSEELKSIFSEILLSSQRVNSYGFILHNRGPVEVEDPIGVGMEVKGDPILRYEGVNYAHTSKTTEGNVTTYVYDYDYTATDGSRQSADLSTIEVEVITDENGLQTVHMDVPDAVLPAYSPYLYADAEEGTPFYYEALPIRLIYQVGLNEEAQAAVDGINQSGESLTYYTNRYEDGIAHAFMNPTNENPYYKIGSETDHDHGIDKSSNPTETDIHCFECHHDRKEVTGEVVPWITQELGNNGKLVFRRTTIDIPVEKIWSVLPDGSGVEPVEIRLYAVSGDSASLVDSVILSEENQWKHSFRNLPILEEGSCYAITEIVPATFAASYGGETLSLTIDGKVTTLCVVDGQNPIITPTVQITNSPAYKLPQTGGTGTQSYYASGLLLILSAALIAVYKKFHQEKGGPYID